MSRVLKLCVLVLGFCLLLPCLGFADNGLIQIVDMKTAQNIDEKYQPVNPTSSFSAETSKVFLWFKWKDGTVNSQINTQWTYLTENIPVLDYKVVIPRHEGSGGVALSMPEGKTLPPGEYEVRVETDKKNALKSVKFRVLES